MKTVRTIKTGDGRIIPVCVPETEEDNKIMLEKLAKGEIDPRASFGDVCNAEAEFASVHDWEYDPHWWLNK